LSPIIRRLFDWLVALFGFAVGVFVIGLLASNEKPSGEWFAFVTMVAFGVVPFVASIVALSNRKRAAYFFLIGGLLSVICVVLVWLLVRVREGEGRISSLLLFLVLTAIVFAGPGTFWLLTERKNWRPIIRHALTLRLQVLSGLCIFSLLLFGAVATGLYGAAMMPGFGDCGEPRPFAAPKSPDHAAFTARIVYVHPVSRYGGWSIARVEQRYWGLPWWNHRFVVLPYRFRPDDNYLVDGYVQPSLVGHLINLMHVHCSRTAPVNDAQVDLRLLRDGPPKIGVRIIGHVMQWRRGDNRSHIAPHVSVTIMEDRGDRVTTMTDELGIYDAMGLPPGHYEVRLDSCTDRSSYGCTCGQPTEEKLETGQVWGCTLRLPVEHHIEAPSRP
jgi:heme/copper-type cytochrome/quinol oxidase subunit 4